MRGALIAMDTKGGCVAPARPLYCVGASDWHIAESYLVQCVQNIPGVVLQTAIRDQVSADASVTAVGTALALQGAVRGGARHIRVTQHSDLRELESARDSLVLGAVSTTSFTIQVRPAPCCSATIGPLISTVVIVAL